MRKYHHLEVGDKDILSNLYIVNQKHTGHQANKSTVKSITKNKKIEITVLEDNTSTTENTSTTPTSIEKVELTNIVNNDKSNILCSICINQFSIYNCPRCFIAYCSSDCFKKHNERCTGLFYEEQIRENLNAIDKVDPKDSLSLIKKMKDIYNREDTIFDSLMNDKDNLTPYDVDDENDPEDDSNDETNIDLSKLNLDEMSEDQLLSLLTKEEIEEFHKSIKDGTISDRLEPWSPWWNATDTPTKPKIIDITDDIEHPVPSPTHLPGLISSSPLVHPNIPALSTIFPNKPSDTLYNHIVDIIYCYCFIMRRFNGDWGDISFNIEILKETTDQDELLITDLCDECSLVIELSTILKRTEAKTVFSSLDQVLETALRSTHQLKSIGSGNDLYFSLFVLEDTSMVFSKKQSILSSLSHLHRHFTLLNQSLTNQKQDVDQLFKLTINFAAHKLWFFMSWCNEQPESNFITLSNRIRDFFIKKRQNK